MPQWLSDYTQGLIARANSVAAEPYQQYGGPRVAGFSTDQTNAFDIVRNNIGDWGDEMNRGSTQAGGALSQAMPYLGSAAKGTPEMIGEYMSPYTQNVIDRSKLEAGRMWDEKMMPDISSRFIKGGQSGSTAHQTKLQQGARDVSEGLQSQAMAALDDAYKTAGTQYTSDANRRAAIGTDIGNMSLESGRTLADMAKMRQGMGLADASSLEAIGSAQQGQLQKNLDLAHSDFEAQRDYPKNQTDWMSGVIRGMPTSTTTNRTETGPYQGESGPSALSQMLSLYGIYKDTQKARGGLVALDNGYAEGGKVNRLRGALSLVREMMGGHDDIPADMMPADDREAYVHILDNDRSNPAGEEVRRWIREHRKTMPPEKPVVPKRTRARKQLKARGGLACLEH